MKKIFDWFKKKDAKLSTELLTANDDYIEYKVHQSYTHDPNRCSVSYRIRGDQDWNLIMQTFYNNTSGCFTEMQLTFDSSQEALAFVDVLKRVGVSKYLVLQARKKSIDAEMAKIFKEAAAVKKLPIFI